MVIFHCYGTVYQRVVTGVETGLVAIQVEFECHDGHPSDLRHPSGVFQQEVAVVQSITGKVLSCTK